ncbi:MAG: GMC oxidoreductase, partial [Vicinamibacterales bacterium]
PMGEPGMSVTSPEGEVHHCPGLYVMDAAAFPTSVGVNPSATIAAAAEFKIESFIRTHPVAPSTTDEWTVRREREKAEAREWVDDQGRPELDPLNRPDLSQSNEPELNLLGLKFHEGAIGSLDDAKGPTLLDDLRTSSHHLHDFSDAEDAGVRKGWSIEMQLDAKSTDLARLISPDSARQPMKFGLEGEVTLKRPGGEPKVCKLTEHSFLQMFLRSADESEPSRFFRYELRYVDADQGECVLQAWKVLRNAPGFDVWLDTSTLFFEIFEESNLTYRGVMRVPIETFLRKQLPSMEITGTTDAARQSWALAAFYQYFGVELAAVYVQQADEIKDLLWKLVTKIHV